MTLLAYTADVSVHTPDLGAGAGMTPTPATYSVIREVITPFNVNVFGYFPFGPYTAAFIYKQPPAFTAPAPVWQVQPSWPITAPLIFNMGLLVAPPAGSKRVSGTFQDQNGAAIGRVGFLYDRISGAFLGSFNSSAIDGSWNAYVPSVNPVFVALMPSPGDSRNGVMLDNLVPI